MAELHDQIFEQFDLIKDTYKNGFYLDNIGSRVSDLHTRKKTVRDRLTWYKAIAREYVSDAAARIRGESVVRYPSKDEEYFEWISLLRAVSEAKQSFTVVELGAGFGRWAARAVLAARQKELDPSVILVEADPVHLNWAHDHMRVNGIHGKVQYIEAAIGAVAGRSQFVVKRPDFAASDEPRQWYGQALNWTNTQHHVMTDRSYFGRPVADNGTGWDMIDVDVVTLDDVLRGVERVDLLDMDIQGAEADVIEGGIDILCAKVARTHIGTHSHEVEARIRSVMLARGWVAEWDFPCTSLVDTVYGPIRFGDGAQAWINPLLRGHDS